MSFGQIGKIKTHLVLPNTWTSRRNWTSSEWPQGMKKASTKRSALCFCVWLAMCGRSTERDIQDHHQAEADGEEDGRPVGVLALGHAGDEVFDDDVDHGTGGEA